MSHFQGKIVLYETVRCPSQSISLEPILKEGSAVGNLGVLRKNTTNLN